MKTATITSAVWRFAVLMGAFLVIAAGSAFGDTVTLENTFSPGHVADTNQYGWVYVMPYTLQDDTTGTTYLVACDTFFRESSTGNPYTVNVNSGGNISETLFPTDTKDYTEAAWLFSMFSPSTPAQTDSDINFAIWALFAGDQGVSMSNFITDAGAGWTSGAATLLSDANNWYASATSSQQTQYLDGLTVFTPASSNQQEFITYQSVPEPSTLALFAIGLLSLLVFSRRKSPVSGPSRIAS